MTLGGWVGFTAIAVCLNLIAAFVFSLMDYDSKGRPFVFIVTEVVVIIVLAFMLWWYGNTESGKRAFKTQQSNFGAGIERSVHVYDVNGKVIAEYEGKFDVVYDNDRILFDDENGKRHVIYYPTGTVIIDER